MLQAIAKGLKHSKQHQTRIKGERWAGKRLSEVTGRNVQWLHVFGEFKFFKGAPLLGRNSSGDLRSCLHQNAQTKGPKGWFCAFASCSRYFAPSKVLPFLATSQFQDLSKASGKIVSQAACDRLCDFVGRFCLLKWFKCGVQKPLSARNIHVWLCSRLCSPKGSKRLTYFLNTFLDFETLTFDSYLFSRTESRPWIIYPNLLECKLLPCLWHVSILPYPCIYIYSIYIYFLIISYHSFFLDFIVLIFLHSSWEIQILPGGSLRCSCRIGAFRVAATVPWQQYLWSCALLWCCLCTCLVYLYIYLNIKWQVSSSRMPFLKLLLTCCKLQLLESDHDIQTWSFLAKNRLAVCKVHRNRILHRLPEPSVALLLDKWDNLCLPAETLLGHVLGEWKRM